jgi:hypothetical protein
MMQDAKHAAESRTTRKGPEMQMADEGAVGQTRNLNTGDKPKRPRGRRQAPFRKKSSDAPDPGGGGYRGLRYERVPASFLRRRDLSANAKLVGVEIAYALSERRGFLSLGHLADAVGATPQTIRFSLDALRESDALTKEMEAWLPPPRKPRRKGGAA